MLILLPPSETKAHGGDGPPLDLGGLSWPQLTQQRDRLLSALEALATDVSASAAALGLSRRQHSEVARNAQLRTSGTMPAIRRYTGVLYDALGAGEFGRPAARERAGARLGIGSALFGAVRAGDQIPAYRFSAGSVLPGIGSPRALWRGHLAAALAAARPEAAAQPNDLTEPSELVVDLRSGSYRALGPVPGALTVDVLTEASDGTRTVVSHFNKAHKGRLARALALTAAEPMNARDVARVARRAGMRVEITGQRTLVVLTGGN